MNIFIYIYIFVIKYKKVERAKCIKVHSQLVQSTQCGIKFSIVSVEISLSVLIVHLIVAMSHTLCVSVSDKIMTTLQRTNTQKTNVNHNINKTL